MKKLNYFAFACIAVLGLSSCSNDDDGPVNEEEVITTITTTLTNGENVITLTSRDLDGDGPNAPVITPSGPLLANTVYNGSVQFLNELAAQPENITPEVLEEGTDHQLFFQAPVALGSFGYSDEDANGNPIGLQFTFTTGNAGTGNITVTLVHEPNKTAAGVSTGNIANAGGATDAIASYPIVIN